MCFHTSLTRKAKEVAARYGRKSDVIEIAEDIINEQYHISAFNNPLYPVATSDPEMQLFQWGLIPFWTKTEQDASTIRTKTYNARAESIFEKPSFRSPIQNKRCLVPATGFFDWRHENGKKIPYYIQLKNEDIFSLAGIYDSWTDRETGEVVYTFSVITTEANPLMRYIHNTNFRMPVVLLREEEEKWLYPELRKEDICQLLQPLDDSLMKAYVIDNSFLRKNPHDPSILCPAESPGL